MNKLDKKRVSKTSLCHGLGVALFIALLTGCDAHGEAETASAPPPAQPAATAPV